MRLLIHHPPHAPNEQGGQKAHAKHSDEIFLLTLMMLVPVIASLPPVSLSTLLNWVLWLSLGLMVSLVSGLVLFLAYLVWSWPKSREVNPMRAVAFKPDLVPPKLDTIVIGSGSGGSTCSNLLAQSGQRVLVLEQHPDRTGGCTHSFREQNCR